MCIRDRAINICQSFCEAGGVAVNYMPVIGLLKEDGVVSGVLATDRETAANYEIRAKRVVNATGIFVNEVVKMDDPGKRDLVVPSQGIHLVTDPEFLNGKDALMIPKTPDGRVLFAIPWHNRVVIGTTDVEKDDIEIEPHPTEEEIDYILETAGRYFEDPPDRKDILSVFAGLRPLAAPAGEGKKTKEISRGHKLHRSGSGLLTITGGKWTIFREMGEDVVNDLEKSGGWKRTRSVTGKTKIHGFTENTDPYSLSGWYGSDETLLETIKNESGQNKKIISDKLGISRAQVLLAVRHEMARTVEDVLARRTRALQMDAAESIRMAPEVAGIMAAETGKEGEWVERQIREYKELAEGYLIGNPKP